MLERSGDLKGELVDFALKRFAWALEQHLDRADVDSEADSINVIDAFVLQHRLPDGRTPLERFAAERRELPEEERELLLGWRDVVEGVFEVKQHDDEALVAVNLVDDLSYRMHSNLGPGPLGGLRPGSFLFARLVPVADEWLLSGMASTLPRNHRREALRVATNLATRHPALVFRNPALLERAWELQSKERRSFVAFFGADLVVVPGAEVTERMRAFMRSRTDEDRDEQGRTAAERARRRDGHQPAEVDLEFPDDLCEAATVGMVYDEVEGLNFYANFGLVQEAFTEPGLAARGRHRQAVRDWLEDPSVSPLPFRRLAERDPKRAGQVFARVLRRRGFSWERDGEALLRRHKASFFQQPVLPGITVLPDRLARHLRNAQQAKKPRSQR